MANRPEMLLGAAVAATVGAVVLAAQGGYKSGLQVAEVDAVRAATDQEPMTTQEKLLLTWTNYTPAAGVAVGALASTLGLHIVHVKDKKQLVAAGLAAVEEAKKSCQVYIDDMKEAITENSTPKTQDKIADSMLEKSAERNNGVAQVWHSDGIVESLYLCRDLTSGRAVWSNQYHVKDAVASLNNLLANDDISLNTFYDKLELENIPIGLTHGWNAGERVEVQWTTERREDGQPICVFKLNPPPAEGFDKSR